MPNIDDKTVARLGKLLPMISSDQPGEVASAVAAILRALAGSGNSVHDLVARLTKLPAERIVYREKTVYVDRPVEVIKEVVREVVRSPDPAQQVAETYTQLDSAWVIEI